MREISQIEISWSLVPNAARFVVGTRRHIVPYVLLVAISIFPGAQSLDLAPVCPDDCHARA
jgi:hypothetical protein